MPVGASMREEQAHLRPPNIEFGAGRIGQRRNPKEATHVEAGEGRSREDPAQGAAQAGGHIVEGAARIAAPVHRVSLRPGVSGTPPDETVAVDLFRRLEDGPLVEKRIEVVELLGRCAVMRHSVRGHVLGEVGLDDGNAHLQQPPVLRLEPFDGLRVGEVNGGARLGEAVHQCKAPTLPSPRGGGRNRLAFQ